MSTAWKGLHVLPTVQQANIPTRVCAVIDDPLYDELPSDSEDEGSEAAILYEDKYIKLSCNFLIIKCYYFPSGKEKRVPVTSISSITKWKQEHTTWGTLDGRIWWNYDFLRGRRSQQECYFVVECPEKFNKGFTCRRPHAFWRHFSSLRPELTRNQICPRRWSQSRSVLADSHLSEDSCLIDNITE